jgi:transposase-like protein
VASDIRAVFNPPEREMAEEYLQSVIRKYGKAAPRLSTWMETNLSEGLSVFSFPVQHRRMIRTTNALERFNREI